MSEQALVRTWWRGLIEPGQTAGAANEQRYSDTIASVFKMSDYQHIPGSIRSFLATKAQIWTDHAADLAAQYSVMCDETNRRLRRCDDYLRRGMSSAAVHLAECQPNLFQAVNWLNFPERSHWAELCVTNGMPAPAMLEAECMEALKVAADREKTIAPLLSRHRLLAIAKAPVRNRLDIALKLAAEDSANPAWPEEIADLEAIRVEEMDAEVQAAVRDQNDIAILRLWDEINGHTWQHEVPEDMREQLRQSAERLHARRVMNDLPRLANDIALALKKTPVDPQLSALLKRWRELVATPGVKPAPDLEALARRGFDYETAELKRKKELEEVKPLEHLFAPTAPELTGGENPHFHFYVAATVISLFVLFAIGVWVWATFIRH